MSKMNRIWTEIEERYPEKADILKKEFNDWLYGFIKIADMSYELVICLKGAEVGFNLL